MQNTNIVETYDYYTLDQAKEIIRQEEAEQKEKRKEKMIFELQQRLCGFGLIAVSIFCTIITKDATIDIITIPIGCMLLFGEN